MSSLKNLKAIGGGLKGGPAITSFNNTLFAAYHSYRNKVYIISGESFGNFQETFLETTHTPAFGALNGSLYCFAPDQNIESLLFMIQSSDGGKTWIGPARVNLGITEGTSVALTTMEVNGTETLFCAYTNESQLIVGSSGDGINWNSVSIKGANTATTPAISVFKGKLVCSFVDNGPDRYVSTAISADGENWELSTSTFAQVGSIATTSMVWQGTETLICAYQTVGVSLLSAMASTDGVHWHNLFPEGTTGISAVDGLSVTNANGELYFAMHSPDENESLNLLSVPQPDNLFYPKQAMTGFDLQYLRRDFVDFHIDSSGDLYGIYKNSTDAGLPGIYQFSKASNYQTCTMKAYLPLIYGEGTWSFLFAANKDLICIKKTNTGTKMLEVHVLTVASNYQTFTTQTGTPWPYPREADQFLLAPNNDLFKIQENQAVEVLTAASGYTKPPAIAQYALKGDDEWGNAPIQYHIDGDRNIYGLQMNGPKQLQVKLYGFAASENYSVMTIGSIQFPVVTAIPTVGLEHKLLMDSGLNVHVLDTHTIGLPYVTHQSYSLQSGYQTPSKQTVTKMSKVMYPEFKLEKGEVAFFRGSNYSGGTWKVSNIANPAEAHSDFGGFVPVNELSSVKLGPGTGISVTPIGGGNPQDYFSDSDQLNGVSEFQVFSTETLAQAGIGYSVMLTEDYRYVNNVLEKYTAYQTILKVAPGVTEVTVFTEKQATIYSGKESYTTDSVQGASIAVPAQSDSIVISVPAAVIGTTALKVRTAQMKPNTFLAIFPDQQVHHKIATLPDNAISDHQSKLGMKTTLTSEECGHVQKAVQNMAKAAKFPAPESPYANPGPMDDAHWQVAFSGGKATYSPMTAAQSQAILNNSQQLSAAGAHGFFGDLFHDVSDVVGFAVHTVEHVASDVIHGVEKVASDAINAAEHVVDDVEHVAGDVIHAAENVANKALNALGVAHLVHEIGDGIEGLADDALHGVEDLAQDAVKAVKVTVQFAEHAVTIVADHTGVVGHLIGGILKKVGAVINDVLNFLSAVFDWTEIARLKDVVTGGVDNLLQKAETEMETVQQDIDNYLNNAESTVNQYISDIQQALGVPKESGSSPISAKVIHQVGWFMSKLQEVGHGFPYPQPNFDLSSSTQNMGQKLQNLETTLISQGATDVLNILETLQQTTSKAASNPGNAEKVIVGGLLSLMQQVADDSIQIAKTIMNFIMEILEDMVAMLKSDLDQSFDVPFLTDMLKLANLPVPSILDTAGYAVALPMTIYEKESGTTLFLSNAAHSVEVALAGKEGFKVLNCMSTYLSGLCNALKAVPDRIALIDYFSVVFNLTNEVGRNPIVVNLQYTQNNQVVATPSAAMTSSPAAVAIDAVQGINKFCWGYQFFPIMMGFLLFKANQESKQKRQGKMKLPGAAINSVLQVPRVIAFIDAYAKESNKVATNGSYYSGEQIASSFLTTLPPFISMISEYGKKAPEFIAAAAALQTIVADAFGAFIWLPPKKNTIDVN